VLRKIFRKICPLIDLLNRNYQCVSSGDGNTTQRSSR
jgi:hypothetical protein